MVGEHAAAENREDVAGFEFVSTYNAKVPVFVQNVQ
jgi:hypothetical protein